MPVRTRTLVLMEPPFCFWDRSMDRLREGEETIPGTGILVLAALARERGTTSGDRQKRAGTTNEDAATAIIALEPACSVSVHHDLGDERQPRRGAGKAGCRLRDDRGRRARERRRAAESSAFDYGVVGEGEHSLFEL